MLSHHGGLSKVWRHSIEMTCSVPSCNRHEKVTLEYFDGDDIDILLCQEHYTKLKIQRSKMDKRRLAH
jgi:hypothetical protein